MGDSVIQTIKSALEYPDGENVFLSQIFLGLFAFPLLLATCILTPFQNCLSKSGGSDVGQCTVCLFGTVFLLIFVVLPLEIIFLPVSIILAPVTMIGLVILRIVQTIKKY